MKLDEHPKPKTTIEQLAKLPPVFKKGGVVTAGGASGIQFMSKIQIEKSWSSIEFNQPKPRYL